LALTLNIAYEYLAYYIHMRLVHYHTHVLCNIHWIFIYLKVYQEILF